MDVIIKGRAQGKTHDLIITSSQTQIPIAASTYAHKGYIRYMANSMGVHIPEPVFIDPVRQRGRGDAVTPVLVDDAEHLLKHILRQYGYDLKGLSITAHTGAEWSEI